MKNSGDNGAPRKAVTSGVTARVHTDSLGSVEIPADVLYGIGTCRALVNSGIGGDRLRDQPSLLVALADVKASSARTNQSLGLLSAAVAEALVRAADEVAAGYLNEHFPLEIVQGGGGTALNTNLNEVLASRATQLMGGKVGEDSIVDPHAHANLSQSTNDVFPTAMSLAVYFSSRDTLEALRLVCHELDKLAVTYAGLEHLGRTCLQDAVPVPVSDLHRAHQATVARAQEDLEHATQRLLDVPLGATAIGTGLGAPEAYASRVIEQLRERTGLPLRSSGSMVDGLASLEPFAAVADAVERAGRALARVAADLRLLASGPVGGFGEVILPTLQAGSSIMPGKINPVMPELVMQAHYQLAGAAQTIALSAGSTDLEVSPMGPVVVVELLTALSRLSSVSTLFAQRCLNGLGWHEGNVARNLTGSFADAVRASSEIGYEAAAQARFSAMVSDLGGVDPLAHTPGRLRDSVNAPASPPTNP